MTTRQRHHDAQRIKRGWKRERVWLDPETLEALARIRAEAPHLSGEGAIRWAINQAALSEIITLPT